MPRRGSRRGTGPWLTFRIRREAALGCELSVLTLGGQGCAPKTAAALQVQLTVEELP